MLYRQASPLRRALRRAISIVLDRLPTGRWLRRVPLLPTLVRGRVMARTDHTGLHWGIYPSFEAALADIPASRLAGWDHEDTSKLWLGQIDPVRPSTYPIFFWLSKILTAGASVVDVGGSIGLTYYAYRRYSALPDGASWTVVEVPSIARQGAAVARREKVDNLKFVDDLRAAPSPDVLLSAGALQFVKESIPGLLEALPRKPRWVLLNKLPVADYADCWTLQNFGPAITPQRLFNETRLIEYFAGHGYRMRDRWAVQDLDCLIPFHPENFIREFAGFVFELTSLPEP